MAADNSESANCYTMSSITGKLVLSLIRGNDYAHAGEEEAIELALARIPKRAGRKVLDVGCGIGGTARYVTEHGWGQVTGIDLDPDNVAVAREHHPDQTFVSGDAAELDRQLSGPFDLVYLFNAFFLFSDKAGALRAMRTVASPAARLVLFDYIDRGGYEEWQAQGKTVGLRSVLTLETMEPMLAEAGWQLDEYVPLHDEYLRWYAELVQRIESKRDGIVERSSEGFYEYVLARYSETLDDARDGRLGGAIFYASAVPG